MGDAVIFPSKERKIQKGEKNGKRKGRRWMVKDREDSILDVGNSDKKTERD